MILKTLAAGALALGLTACAEQPTQLSGAAFQAASNSAFNTVCLRKRTGASPMTPAWDSFCKARGL